VEFVDTHCHIQSAGQKNGEEHTRKLWDKAGDTSVDEIVSRANEAGVSQMICVGCDVDDSELAVRTVKSRENLFASIGIHPHEAQQYAGNTEELDRFAALATQEKVVAVGECGLDFFYTHSPKAAQIEILEFQLQLARETDLPVIFHVREAFDDFWPVLDNFEGIRGVLHSFTDNQANLDKAVQKGLYIGVNGIATFSKNEEQLAMYKAIPREHLVLETDAPYLTPVPLRGTICEPKHVVLTAEFLALLRGDTAPELAYATTQNARSLFNL
jgi:TatD DNase family protein